MERRTSMTSPNPPKRRGLNYESRIVAIPLECGGYARGVVARHSRNGVIVFTYPEYYPSVESLESAPAPKPEAHFCAYWTYSSAISKGEWKTCGKVAPWDRELWRRADWRAGTLARKDPDGSYYMTLSDAEGYPVHHQVRLSTKEEHDSCLSDRGLYDETAVEVALSHWICSSESPYYYGRSPEPPR